tara:strand:+ start:2350 stop:3864 length:1515 start_codon:yes stop_codon:yes gene_type:complete
MSTSKKQNPWLVLSTMFILLVLVDLDYTAVSIALVAISKDVESDLNKLQWLISGYVLAWSAFVVAAGRLSDIYGKRKMLLLGVWGFLISSALCGLAQSDNLLIFARGLQGLSGALFVPPIYALVFASFPENKRGFAIGILGVGVGIGLALGPPFSGFILEHFSWRWIFLVNVPLCLLVILKTYLFVDKSMDRGTDEKLHMLTTFLLFAGLILMMVALNQSEVWGFSDPGLWCLLGAGTVALILFERISARLKSPLIPRKLYKRGAFLVCCTGYGLLQFLFSLILILFTLYVQNVKDFSPQEAGILFLPMTVLMGLFSPFGGKLCDLVDVRWPVCAGLICSLIGFCLSYGFNEQTSQAQIVSAFVFYGLGLGLGLPSFNAVMLKTVPESMLSTASGVFTMIACFGCTAGTVISTSLLVGLSDNIFLKKAQTLSESTQHILKNIFAEAHWSFEKFPRETLTVQEASSLLKETFSEAFSVLMGLGIFISILAILLCWNKLKNISSQE